MKSIAAFTPLLLSLAWVHSPLQAAERPVMLLGAEFWATPRHGVQLLQPPLRMAVEQLRAEPDAYLIVHHGDDESGQLWGRELQSWLISLGIVSERIELRGGYDGDAGVALRLFMPDGVAPAQQGAQGSDMSGGAGGGSADAPLPVEMEPQ